MEDFYNNIIKYINIENIHTIVDAGSLDGNDALFLKSKFLNSICYAIEGLPDNFNNYLKNSNLLISINAVLAEYDGTIIFHQKNINGIHGIYDRGSEYGNIQLELECYKFSTIIKKYSIPNIDILKIDVEGATLDILKSLEKNLEYIKIMHIETETYPFFKGQSLHNEVCEFLIKNNFVLIDITFVEITPNNYQSDSVWLNKILYNI